MNQYISLPDDAEDVGLFGKPLRDTRVERLVPLNWGNGQIVKREKPAKVQWAGDMINICLIHLQMFAEDLQHLFRDSFRDFEPDGNLIRAVLEFRLYGLQQIQHRIFMEIVILVAGYTEGNAVGDFHSGEKAADA